MSMEYIRKFYNVPAKRGAEVTIKTPKMGDIKGVIVASRGAYLRIRTSLPKSKILTYHPTDHIEYHPNRRKKND